MMKDSEKEPFWWDNSGFETNFVENMVELRQLRGMSQSELAKRASAAGLQFHQPTVQRIETGERPIRLTEAVELAQILGSTVLAMMHSPTGSGVRRNITDLLDKKSEFPIMRGRLISHEQDLKQTADDLGESLNQLRDDAPQEGDDELRVAAQAHLDLLDELREIYQTAISDITRALDREKHSSSLVKRAHPAWRTDSPNDKGATSQDGE